MIYLKSLISLYSLVLVLSKRFSATNSKNLFQDQFKINRNMPIFLIQTPKYALKNINLLTKQSIQKRSTKNNFRNPVNIYNYQYTQHQILFSEYNNNQDLGLRYMYKSIYPLSVQNPKTTDCPLFDIKVTINFCTKEKQSRSGNTQSHLNSSKIISSKQSKVLNYSFNAPSNANSTQIIHVIPSINQSNISSTTISSNNLTNINNLTSQANNSNINPLVISSVSFAPITVQSQNGFPNQGNNEFNLNNQSPNNQISQRLPSPSQVPYSRIVPLVLNYDYQTNNPIIFAGQTATLFTQGIGSEQLMSFITGTAVNQQIPPLNQHRTANNLVQN